MSINFDSIEKKAKAFLSSADGMKRVNAIVDAKMMGATEDSSPHEAAEKFISILRSTIQGSPELGVTAQSALIDFDYGHPYKNSNDTYSIGISFKNDLHRRSLFPSRYPEGVENIAALLERGYDTGGKKVFGVWHGDQIQSLTKRTGAHFIETAVRDFMGNYASKYGVVDIKIDDAYGIRN